MRRRFGQCVLVLLLTSSVVLGLISCDSGSSSKKGDGWELVSSFGMARAVAIDSQHVDDTRVYAGAVRALAKDQEIIQVLFFDSRQHAPQYFPLNDDQMRHYVAMYSLNKKSNIERFVRIWVADSSTTPPTMIERPDTLGFSLL